ncbi:putative retrotransposon gag domain-containing protein [Helianthus annuus]|nr:putative retrotransposon gag domain-containing protein [Helianthus annuus]
MASVGGMPLQQIIPQHIRPRPQGPTIQQPIPLQQVRPQHVHPQFQRPNQYPPMPQQPIAPQGFIPRPMGPIRPRGRLGVPRRHLREQARGIEAHFRPIITQNPSPVVIPHNNQGRTFEVRTNSLQSLPKYKGLATEEPYFHLEAYDSICNTFGSQGFSADEVKLVLFQFSLEDKAKKWFYTLPSASIYTWGEMQQTFLDEFYTAQKTNDARKGLRSFQQQHGEMFHEAFERFNMMIKNCPHHGIELWELMNAFHEGLSAEDARDLMSITGGTFGTNYENEDWEFLESMATTSKRKAQASRRARPTTNRPQVHAIDDGIVVKEMAKTKEKAGSSSSSSKGKGKGKEKEQPSKKRQYMGRVSESESEGEEEQMELDPSDKPVWNSGSLDDQPEIWQPTLYNDCMNKLKNKAAAFICEKEVDEPQFGQFGVFDKFRALGWEGALKCFDKDKSNLFMTEIQEWMATLKCHNFHRPSQMKLIGMVHGVPVEMSFDTLKKLGKYDSLPAKEYMIPTLDDLLLKPEKHVTWNSMLADLFLPDRYGGVLYRKKSEDRSQAIAYDLFA